jgi:hypothetical protein
MILRLVPDHGEPASDLRKLVGDTGIEPVTSSVSRCRHGRPGSAIGRVTCGPAEGALSDSLAFTPIVLAALGSM